MESKKRNSLKSFNHAKKIIFLAFLLSLLFHTGSILYIWIKKPTQQDIVALQNKEDELQKIKEKRNKWVETKARAGNFGTPVFFKDEFEPESIKTQQNEQVDNKPEIVETKEEDIPEKKETTEEPAIEKAKSSEVKSYFAEASSVAKTIEDRPKDKPASMVTKDSQPKPTVHKKQIPLISQKPQSTNTQQLSAPKPPLTLAQLTQGFLNHIKNEGNHTIHMLGKKNGRPSDEQIKYERYLQKLSWCLQNSFNIHNDRFPSSANMNDTVQVLLALNKDGSMKHCHISRTSGNRDLDHFTLFIFNDASTSFPPVPQYLPHNPFTMNYIVMVSASEENRLRLYRR